MTDDVDNLLARSQRIESHDHEELGAEDSYFTVHLHQFEDGRYFRYVEASGMNTSYAGAGHFVEWLGDHQDTGWKEP